MNPRRTKYSDMATAKKEYAEGRNITAFLREKWDCKQNTTEIIEMAYDLQAGSYIRDAESNTQIVAQYCSQLSDILGQYVSDSDSLLDVGTGEMTTLPGLLNRLGHPKEVFAFDTSWSRLYQGLAYVQKNLQPAGIHIRPFAANICEIPLQDGSIDVITSSHALEPNGGKLETILKELFRVARKTLALFEPCYEINSDEGKKRMDQYGYIKNLDGIAEAIGGTVVDKIKIDKPRNPLNPTVCFVIRAPDRELPDKPDTVLCSAPGSNFPLEDYGGFYYSKDTGFGFPVIESIPILKSDAGALATGLSDA